VPGPSAAFASGEPAPDAVHDLVGDGVVQAWLADRALGADLPGWFGGLAAFGEEQVQVGAAARGLLPPARSKPRRGKQGGVTRAGGRQRAGAVTRARQAAAKAARSDTSRPLAAKVFRRLFEFPGRYISCVPGIYLYAGWRHIVTFWLWVICALGPFLLPTS
jgi:hypothetical protein